MQSLIARSWRIGLSLLFAVAAVLFWSLPYVSALNYHEQYQLFLWTSDYFSARISVPGGLADYIAELITQFNYLPVLGAILIAALFLLLQRLTWALTKRLGGSNGWYGLSFLPVLVLWVYESDPNVLQSLTIGLIAALAAVYIVRAGARSNRIAHVFTLIVLLPAFYWLFGVAVYIVALAALFESMKQRRWFIGLFAVVYAALLVYASSYIVPFPESRVLIGLHFYRYPVGVPAMQWIVMGVVLLTPYISAALPQFKSWTIDLIFTLIILALGGAAVWRSFDNVTHELIAYDYLVRTEQWDAIIHKAEKNVNEPTPLEVSVLNLALSQKGQLLDRLFAFYQNGSEGLFPSFTRDILSPIPTAELFFRLGFVNDCERYCFEALQAIPDYQRSGRLLKRITQCEVANGQYEVAQRYLRLLKHSTFYSAWAESTLALLGDEEKLNANPTYARLRANREQQDDYLFSEWEMDQMVGLLLMNNQKNRMAYEYLIAYELLQRDLQHFDEYYVLGQRVDYKRIPTVVQEVLIGRWLQAHGSLQGMPYSVEQTVLNATIDYLRAYMNNPDDPHLDEAPLKYNAWHYLLQR